MSEQIRFHLDEQVDPEIALQLRHRVLLENRAFGFVVVGCDRLWR